MTEVQTCALPILPVSVPRNTAMTRDPKLRYRYRFTKTRGGAPSNCAVSMLNVSDEPLIAARSLPRYFMIPFTDDSDIGRAAGRERVYDRFKNLGVDVLFKKRSEKK